MDSGDGERKRSASEIGAYFDGEVERFSDLSRGQLSIKDARLMMDLLAEAASVLVPGAGEILDIGCGAGNQTLNLLRKFPDANCTLLDLSSAMLERARERVGGAIPGRAEFLEGDLRTAALPEGKFDVAVAAAVLHHLRDDADWELGFSRIHSCLKVGGVLLVSDLIRHENPKLEAVFKVRHEAFLRETLGDAEAERIMRSIAASDTPSPLEYQFDLLRRVGFREVALLHKNLVFAAYCAVK
jgi:tRNA (cmo5U34)-methyltransferase